MLIKWLNFKTDKFNFIRYRVYFLILSSSFIVVSLTSLGVQGLNLGIDFVGGILIEAETKQDIGIKQIREKLNNLNLGSTSLQEFGQANIVLMRIQKQEGGAEAQQRAISRVKNTLKDDVVEYRRVESVGPTFSKELRNTAIIAVLLTMLGIFSYIWLRFEWQFGLGAVLALLHDVITTIGLFSIFQLEVNIATVAAILTIAGYSINDTVVIYDRIRENIRKYKNLPLDETYNMSLNQMITRTLLTTITTLLALIALVLFGGEVIRNFAIPLIWGVFFGTYSSIGFAVPFVYLFPARTEDEEGKLAEQ